ncbi:hypothetical protein FRC01_013621 [Tulasnella sp. 417]|nr:hypothetical protein FRC01_013621 [Tulasnella sp. 417]
MAMYKESFSAADLKPAPNTAGLQRGQRSLHGSQSHSNLTFSGAQSTFGTANASTSTPGAGFNESTSGGQPTYMPGYLLAASQGQPPPAQVRDFSIQPLETEKSLKRGPSAYGRGFGEESLLSVGRPSPKGRSPRTPMSVNDDENAPPTLSMAESQYAVGEKPTPRLNYRHSVGGFHPLRQSTTPFTPNSSMSTTYESNTPFRPTADDAVTAPQGSYSVTIFGFTTLGERRSAVEQFLTESAKVIDDDSASGGMDVDGDRLTRNWVEIVYSNQWDAVRAVRRSGHVTLRGGEIWIGARWTDPSQEPSPAAFAAYESRQQPQTQQMSQPPLTPAPLGGSTRAVRLKPSASAFRSNATITSTSAPRAQQPVDEWGLADKAKQVEGGAAAQQPAASGGFFGSVKNAVLGW